MSERHQIYHFKDIPLIPSSADFIDVVLSKTQRKTPTEVHKQFKISRIRAFYMRKVKFCQQTIHDKLTGIITAFPKLDEIHPFYSDFLNVLYDRDHYKLALGQCCGVRAIVDTAGKDYVRLMKFADSLYKCKMLKRAALGRMCTAIKKLRDSFAYLEDVRQHLARLPSINPDTRTIILCGYPNVGKSSLMNLLTNANVEVQPYAFTTRCLFVGHFDYNYTRWQMIDTPGILDRPLNERNTIEMLGITALAHINCTAIYIFDLSESCGYRISEQIDLFKSIGSLFKNKPIICLFNKSDLCKVKGIQETLQLEIQQLAQANDNIVFMESSAFTAEGVDEVKSKACELLLKARVEKKCQISSRMEAIANRLYITKNNKEESDRKPFIPENFGKNEMVGVRKIEKQLQEEHGGPGVYSVDLRKNYILEKPEWKYDIVPEIFDGKNIADFIDPDIERKVNEIEKEEEQMLKMDSLIDYEEADWGAHKEILSDLYSRIIYQKMANKMSGINKRKSLIGREKKLLKIGAIETHLKARGYETEKLKSALELNNSKKSKSRLLTKRKLADVLNKREEAQTTEAIMSLNKLDCTDKDKSKTERKMFNKSLAFAKSGTQIRGHRTTSKYTEITSGRLAKNRIMKGLPRLKDQVKAVTLKWKHDKKISHKGLRGEGDRFIGNKKPKHLFSGKRGIGKTQRR